MDSVLERVLNDFQWESALDHHVHFHDQHSGGEEEHGKRLKEAVPEMEKQLGESAMSQLPKEGSQGGCRDQLHRTLCGAWEEVAIGLMAGSANTGVTLDLE